LKRLSAWLSRIWRAKKGRPVSLALLIVLSVLLIFPEQQPFRSARLALFDEYQILFPRQPHSQPVVIVEIDEEALGALGQWPWPRNYFAALIDAIAALKPAAIGLDIIMPEADHASPQAVAESRTDLSEAVRNELTGAASNDHLLASSFAAAPIVLGAAGFSLNLSSTQDVLHGKAVKVQGDSTQLKLNSYPYVLASIPEFQAAAHGQALLSSNPENGILRRAAELSNINGTITPGLALEMMRVAHEVPNIGVDIGSHGVNAVSVGAQTIPMQGNGEAWIHYDSPSRQRYISAVRLLKNEIPAERIRGKMVLVGLTGLGLLDVITTPLGDLRPGVEVHAQLIESFEDGHFLTRPWWMHWAELIVLLGGGLLLIWIVPHDKFRKTFRQSDGASEIAQRSFAQFGVGGSDIHERRKWDRSEGIKPQFTVMLVIFLLILFFGTGILLFNLAGLLFDAVSPFVALIIVFGSLLFSVFIEAGQQRKNAELALQNQRLKAAQLAGELDAARRIQLGTLPVAATSFPGETRFEIDAMLEPARQVGGDLYDFFMIDHRHLFFVIGDVSGKGLPASLFMVVTKALAKSAALRKNDGIGAIINLANLEMARENPEMLFVTVVAGILDLENGALEMVNAGHDAPLRIDTTGHIESLNGDGGPPLCVLEDFDYPVQRRQLAEGDTLLLLTDGITEAMNANKELYGMERVTTVLGRALADHPPRARVAALREDVRQFVGETEASDDLTLLVIRWLGANE
jgi:serine phosphatase RsbU (regulator of sigma subunit)